MKNFYKMLICGFGFYFFCSSLAAVECENYYFGLGVPQDYKKAFDCYRQEKDPDIIALVLMYINGEGTTKDANKASEILDNYIKRNGSDASTEMLKQLVTERLKHPQSDFKRVEYKDVAITTLAMNYWLNIQSRIEEQNNAIQIMKIKQKLNPEAKKIFDLIQVQFKIIEENEGKRIYMEWIEGTIRDAAATEYKRYLMKRHQKRIISWLLERKLEEHADQAELKKTDDALNTIYQKMLQDGDKMLKEANENNVEMLKKDYLFAVKTAQRAWMKYRDVWVKLLIILKPKNMQDEKVILNSVVTQLTKERVEELKYNPVTDESPER